MRITGRIDLRVRTIDTLIHGAGTRGNSTLLRMQDIILDDGTPARVPFISGNSIKHKLRECAVKYALDAMNIEDGSLSKAETDLLFSGGHLNKSGAAVDLTTARKLEELFPPLSLCGYSAGNTMTESKIRVSHLHLVCMENAWRLPDDMREHVSIGTRAGQLYITGGTGDGFGTRHEQSNRPHVRKLLTEEAGKAFAAKKSKKLKGEDDGKKDDETAQMIYEHGGIKPGATLWGTIQVADLTELEQAALASAFHYASTERRGESLVMTFGAKSNSGMGGAMVDLRGQIRVAPPQYVESTELVAAGDNLTTRYLGHLRDRKDEILDTIKRAVS